MATPASPPLSAPDQPRDIGGPTGREILVNLTIREIRTQFKRTALGRIWSFVNPLATLAILSFVFGFFIKVPIEPSKGTDMHLFVLFLASALIPWNFISGGITSGMNALVANAGLLTKVYFPRWVLPVSVILSLALTFVIELSVLVVLTSFFGGPKIFLFLPALVVLAALTVAFVCGIAMALSIALVYFRDTQHFVSLLMQLWFYATPIIYPLSLIENAAGDRNLLGIPLTAIYQLNPAVSFTGAFRSVIYDYSWPSWGQWLGCLIWAVLSLALGMAVFRRFSARVVEEI